MKNMVACIVLFTVAGIRFQRAEGMPKKLAVDFGDGVKMETGAHPSGRVQDGQRRVGGGNGCLLQQDLRQGSSASRFFKDEHPQHRVRITKPFYLGTYHVTRGQFRQFVADAGTRRTRRRAREPGAWGWDPDKKGFGVQREVFLAERGFRADRRAPGGQRELERRGGVLQVAQQEGRQDLPTANGGRVGICLPCRDDNPVLQRRRSRDAGQGRQRGRRHGQGEVPGLEVTRSKPATAMCSPLRWESSSPMPSGCTTCTEMCGSGAGLVRREYYSESPADDPTGPDSGNARVLRGGSWYYWAVFARSANRYKAPPLARCGFIGFRVARSLEEKRCPGVPVQCHGP